MNSLPEQYTSLAYLRPLPWTEVFATWKELEASQESWQRHWTERGFGSWDEWRVAYAAPLHPEKLSWELYEITEPLREALLLYGTPTKGWVEKAYAGETTKQLQELIQLPIIAQNDKVQALQEDFPQTTMLTGLVHKDKIVLIEGMHRGSALASWNPAVPFTGKVTIALSTWPDALPILGGNTKPQSA